MKVDIKKISILWAAILLCVSIASPAQAQEPTPFANCRLGAGGSSDVTGYDLGQLNLGLYSDWTTQSSRPAGLPTDVEYIQTVRVHQDKVCGSRHCVGDYVQPPSYSVWPGLTTLASRAADQPGMLWLIGNEIDRRDWESGGSAGGQDEMTAELYATAFHEIQDVIKTADPTAKIGIAGVIQGTPLRLEYLDRIWDSHQAQYGYSMGNDIDVWNVHGFILREVRGEWGADTPPGIDTNGFLAGAGYSAVIDAHHDIAHFQQFIEDFRAWMADHGQRNKPLLITEYGILYGSDYGISTADIIDFMEASFDYSLNARDEATGYPADENRLVQGWIWYSLNDDTSVYRDGALFNSTTKSLTTLGNAWQSYVSDPANPLASIPQRNLLVTNLRASPNPVFIPTGGARTVTLRVDVANRGNTKTSTEDNIVVNFWDGEPGSNLIASRTIEDVPGCSGIRTVEAQWEITSAGEHPWYAEVVPIAEEPTTSDNIDSDVVIAFEGGNAVFLPAIMK